MADGFFLAPWQGVESTSKIWYKNLQTIDTGGNSVVFFVFANTGENVGVPYALKVFRKISRPERKDNFFNEIKFLQTNSHPTIMKVVDFGTFNTKEEFPFLISEYYSSTLKIGIEKNAYTTQEKLLISLQLISAISFLSSLDIAHRDIKPSNIFLNGRTCVLGDFGLIKQLKNQTDDDREIIKTSPGAGMAFYYRTPDLKKYASEKYELTPQTDIYQLGLVLAELFTGVNPQKAAEDISDPIEMTKIEKIESVHGGLICTALNEMLREDPEKRATHKRAYELMQSALEKTIKDVAKTSAKPF
ncbi:MAG TPA: hypothetical protein DEV75_00320 [Desulfovibrio sp.]|jgi:serine/threonine protein kinase|nr:hypothetical protein [Desulfovibrio sp.]